jgi:hypothetical protein
MANFNQIIKTVGGFLITIALFTNLVSCKKDIVNEPIEDDTCVLTSYLGNLQPYYYDDQKRLVGRVITDYNRSKGVSPQSFVYDTVVYSDNTITIYTLDLSWGVFRITPDTIPSHEPLEKYYKKAVAELTNGKITAINYYTRNVVETLNYRKEISYQNNKISKINLSGNYEICDALPSFISHPSYGKTQSEYVYTYFSTDSVHVLGTTKFLDGRLIGKDTINSVLGSFRNPLMRDKNLPLFFNNVVLSRLEKTWYRGYFYSFPNSTCSLHGPFANSPTDNGNGYPKEMGTYKCD